MAPDVRQGIRYPDRIPRGRNGAGPAAQTEANRGFRAIETLTRFDTVTRRMHNKSFSVDDTMTIVGGRNVGDEYYGVHENVNFGDLDVLAMGPAAVKLGEQFDFYWNSALAYPIQSLAGIPGDLKALRRELIEYAEAQRDSPYAKRARDLDLVPEFVAGTLSFQWGHALVYCDLPEKLATDPEDRSTHTGPKVWRPVSARLRQHVRIASHEHLTWPYLPVLYVGTNASLWRKVGRRAW